MGSRKEVAIYEDDLLAYQQTIRDLLHLLDTAEGYWVTDRPMWEHPFISEMQDGPGEDNQLCAAPGTFFRQTFRDTEAVKRARDLVKGLAQCGAHKPPHCKPT